MHYFPLPVSKKTAYALSYKDSVAPSSKYTKESLDLYLRLNRPAKFKSGRKIPSASYLPSWLVKVAIIPYSIQRIGSVVGGRWTGPMHRRCKLCEKKGAYSFVQSLATIVPGSSCKGRRLYWKDFFPLFEPLLILLASSHVPFVAFWLSRSRGRHSRHQRIFGTRRPASTRSQSSRIIAREECAEEVGATLLD